ncbi:lipase secretion chaperone [Acinetobacter gerneri]|uniref:lipase secretion chaperone n=1 Tax=Acinetobacter gerneri TaxID=202952 RepID=UPI0029366181|nr:lipase secretion chaperone [Acinetobacter gerneri]MDV2438469.1 lipase secretion chaperone [Acinetobacter gerneri]
MLKNNKKIAVLVGALLVVLIGLIYFLKPSVEHSVLGTEVVAKSSKAFTAGSSTTQVVSNQGLPSLSKSLDGTQLDCPIKLDKDGKLILSKGIRDCFDYFFSTLGEKSEQQLVNDINQYLTTTLPESAATYAKQLLQKYISYKKGLFEFQKNSNIKVRDQKSYENMLQSIAVMQKKYFTAPEIQAFFGMEMAFNVYDLEKMKINTNKQLNASQKAEKIAELIDELPDELAEGIRTTEQFSSLQALTQEIKDRGGSKAEIRSMREKLLGVEAADRLDKVDTDDANWQSRVDNYLSQRDKIINSSMDESSKQQAVNEIRQNTFQTREEQIRSQTFEQMHDKQTKNK